MERLAKNGGVKVRTYKIIYELIDEVKTDLSKLLVPEVKDLSLIHISEPTRPY